MSARCSVCYYDTGPVSPEIEALLPAFRLRELATLPADRRKQGVLAEALLRLELSRLSGTAPKEHVILREKGKKPFCKSFHFSLSHTRGAVAVLVSDYACGADIERISSPRMRAGRLCFTADEYALAQTSPERFWELWTRKEAIFKAGMCGDFFRLHELDSLSHPLSELLRTEVRNGFCLSLCGAADAETAYITELELSKALSASAFESSIT
ncbi:MAG: 4'-phosphopantetheinyl transferase family protein [Candidatus Heteroscillospira sp.]|jgi:phosphopantetheinyl transferase